MNNWMWTRLLLDFEPQPAPARVVSLSNASDRRSPENDAYLLFIEAERLEHNGRTVEAEKGSP
jgi:hypothetical protein